MPSQYTTVIPAYNASATISEAIDSVLSQTIPPSEIIVVDDGSTDDTTSIVAGTAGPIRLIRRHHAGPGAATTEGIGAVSTPLLAALDSDDVWLPTKIERQLDYLATHPHVTVAFTLTQLFHGTPPQHSAGRVQRFWSRSAMLIDTSSARSVGAIIDPPGGRGDMIDWLARCVELGHHLGMVDEVLTLRRVRPGSLSYGRDTQRDVGYLHVARQAIERRRQQSRAA